MRNKLFKFVCIVCVFSVLNIFVGCTPKPDMVTKQDICEMYNENKELFERTAKEVEELTKKLPEINGLSFRYVDNMVKAYSINTQFSFNFPDGIYDDLKNCFLEMESIINEEFDEDEYILSISCSRKGSLSEDISVIEFGFYDNVILVSYNLTCSEDEPGYSYTVINDNWYISWWGQV
ncbi:MAG: hypothetical protein ACI4VW_05275 [Acutalibacteraceae bacterium]